MCRLDELRWAFSPGQELIQIGRDSPQKSLSGLLRFLPSFLVCLVQELYRMQWFVSGFSRLCRTRARMWSFMHPVERGQRRTRCALLMRCFAALNENMVGFLRVSESKSNKEESVLVSDHGNGMGYSPQAAYGK